MTRWANIKDDPVNLQKHNENSKNHATKKYDEDPVYREYMKNNARVRKAMLKVEK